MQFRHEVKNEISYADMLTLRARLSRVMAADPHAKNGVYEIRSLYFDSIDDSALREKLDGVAIREKYRIRMYNGDPSFLKLERKYKCGSLGYKETVSLTPEQAQALARGEIDWMARETDETMLAMYTRIREKGLRPRVIVDYTREPFVMAAGNVRVTLDYHLRTGLRCTDFLDPTCVTVPAAYAPILLEVKWDSFLPDIVRDAVQLEGRHTGAFSKYAACRMYE